VRLPESVESPALQRLTDYRESLVAAGSVVADADGGRRELAPVAIGEDEGRALREWVRREHAERTLEIGLGFGISTLFICEGLLANGSDGRHVAIDPYQFDSLTEHTTTYAGVGLQILEEAGVRDLVEFHEEESALVLPRLLAEGRRFDLCFVDGNHRFEGVFVDLLYTGRLLKEAGIVFVDDVQLRGVRRAIDFFLTNLGWSVEDEGAEGEVHEWMVLRTGPSERLRRPLADFVDF
jgi:predicted O-methyltransferase YrrM